jgi:hypothetical protein
MIMKKYEQIREKFIGRSYPIITEQEFDEAVNEILEENAYLRRLALHALSGWAMGMSMANHYLAKGSRKKQVAYYIFFKKFENLHNIEKDKWRKEKCKK